MPTKVFRDPVHGNIEVDQNSELRLVDSWPFQRLRQIRQLALTNLIYHGAEHTRFGHSLGVMEIAGRMFDRLRAPGGGLEEMSADEGDHQRRLLRLAALLHDVGHSPFSHALELGENLFPDGENHETMGVKILEEELHDTIDSAYHSFDIKTEDVVEVLEHTLPANQTYLWQILSGPLDADKTDYLLRDAHYCGVRYGIFDLERILSKLVVHDVPDFYGLPDRVLGLGRGATEAYEEFFLARHWMNAQVYMHPVRRQLDIIVRKLVADLLPGRRFPSDVGEYLSWDEARVFFAASESTSPWAQRLRGARPFFYCAYRDRASKQRAASGGIEEAPKTSEPTALQRYSRVVQALEQDKSLRGHVYPDTALLKNKDYSDHKTDEGEANQIPFFVRREKDDQLTPIADDSDVIRSVPDSVSYFFVFVDPSLRAEADKIVDEMAKDSKVGRS